MKLGTKITLGFVLMITIIVALGASVFWSAERTTGAVWELGCNRLPSLESLLIMKEAQTAVDSAENVLLCLKIRDEDRAGAYKRFDQAKARADQAWKIYDPLPQTDEEALVWKQFVPAWEKWWKDHEAYVALVKQYEADKKSETYDAMAQQGIVADGVSFAAAETLLNKLVEINHDCADVENNRATGLASFSQTISMVATGIGVVLGAVVAFVIIRSITRPIRHIADILAVGAEQAGTAAGQVSTSAQELAQGASEQAAAIEETSSSMEEMASMTRQNAQTAEQAATLAADAQKAAERGNASMARMSSSITEIQSSAAETAKILKVIDEIAFQTNLLALNAAVEAARAGEAGKGFAVVAEEVRNLAQRSAEAAKNTASLIERSVQSTREGVTITAEVGKALEEITAAANKVNGLVAEIAAASHEQSKGIDQMTKAVTDMDKVTQGNAAAAEESATAAEELAAQAEQVSASVGELLMLVNGSAARSSGSALASKRPMACDGAVAKVLPGEFGEPARKAA